MTNGLQFNAAQGKTLPSTVMASTDITGSQKGSGYGKWMLPAGAGLLLGFVLLALTRKRKMKSLPVAVVTEHKPEPVIIKQNPLEDSERCLRSDDCTDFYILLKMDLKDFLTCRFALEKSLKRKEIIEALDNKNVSNEIVVQLDSLLQEIELQLYTPFERNSRMEDLYTRTQETVQRLNHCGSVNL